MDSRALGPVLQLLRHSELCRGSAGLPDDELLERFLVDRDQAAFEALLRRHGPMVLGVCRRVLENEDDAEDAFQATFLVLVRKARTVRPRGMVGNWLYGVARSTALKARAMNSRRRAKEKEAATASKPAATGNSPQELEAALDQELQYLPDRYRAPIVLCDLEGRSVKEAAQQLGCPAGTLGSRLSRGRALLRRRLARYGLPLPGGLIAAALSERAAAASLPAALAASTLKAASLFGAGRAAAGAASAHVIALTEGVLKTMLLTKIKAGALVLLAGMTIAGAGVFSYRTLAGEQPGRTPAVLTNQAPKASDAARIGQLIDQLGSNNFADREKATKELDRIGAPALDALRKAAQGDDPERKRGADELVRKIEGRDQEARLLTPRRVRLVYKDTPLAEAVANFKKQCGYDLTLSDPEGKLKDRTITLDTGDVTFWRAFDLFCRTAGLVVAAPQPAAGPRVGRPGQAGQARPVDGRAAEDRIVLTDGKAPPLPTDDRTAVRVRALNKTDRVGIPAEGEILLALEITPEPKLRRLQILTVRVRKATDDQGQNLEQVAADGVAPIVPGIGGPGGGRAAAGQRPGQAPVGRAGGVPIGGDPGRDVGVGPTPVRLKKGAKAATSLTEISGTITVRVLVEGQPAGEGVTVEVPFTLKDVPLP